jgi:hypothetical protein
MHSVYRFGPYIRLPSTVYRDGFILSPDSWLLTSDS